jgi:hypothetical protein
MPTAHLQLFHVRRHLRNLALRLGGRRVGVDLSTEARNQIPPFLDSAREGIARSPPSVRRIT